MWLPPLEQDTTPQPPPSGVITAAANELAQVQLLPPHTDEHEVVVVALGFDQQQAICMTAFEVKSIEQAAALLHKHRV